MSSAVNRSVSGFCKQLKMFYFTILSVLKDKSRYVLQRSGRLMKKHYTISVVEEIVY